MAKHLLDWPNIDIEHTAPSSIVFQNVISILAYPYWLWSAMMWSEQPDKIDCLKFFTISIKGKNLIVRNIHLCTSFTWQSSSESILPRNGRPSKPNVWHEFWKHTYGVRVKYMNHSHKFKFTTLWHNVNLWIKQSGVGRGLKIRKMQWI